MDEIWYYMEEPLLSVDSGISLTDASKFMLENQVSGLLVTGDGNHVGIITEKYFTWKVLAMEQIPSKTKISTIMSKPYPAQGILQRHLESQAMMG